MLTNTTLFLQFSPENILHFLPEEVPLERIVFFDIETTGLSHRTSQVYLIGAVLFQNGQWMFSQFLAENEDSKEESAVLEAFSSFIKDRNCFIHYNGSTFDIPYLQHKYAEHKLPSPFEQMLSIDLYRILRPFAPILNTENAKQKSLEPYAGYQREDSMSGKELIKVYHFYTCSKKLSAQKLLLTHNHDDVEGMTHLLKLANLKLLFQGFFDILEHKTVTHKTESGELAEEVLFILSLPATSPLPLSFRLSFFYVTIEKHICKIKIPLLQGTLKYFYPDYKNYYYLISEDEAVHKSIGVYVDPGCRQKATAKNCYKRVSGYFLKACGTPECPVLKESYDSDNLYIQWTDAFIHNRNVQKSYLSELLKNSLKP